VDQPFIPASFFDLTQIRHLTLTGFNIDKFIWQLKGLFLHHLESITIACFTKPHLSALNATLEDLISRIRRVKTVRIVTTGDLIPTSHFIHLSDTLTNFELRALRNCIDSYPYLVTRHFYKPGEQMNWQELAYISLYWYWTWKSGRIW
jgi:hypothetical protein